MRVFIEDNRLYVSAEPAHYGMIQAPPDSDMAFRARLQTGRRPFLPVAFPVRERTVDMLV